MSRLKQKYQEEVVPSLMAEYEYGNRMRVPHLEKVVINIGLGEAIRDARALEAASQQVAAISGQRPVVTRAKRSIAGFRLRAGMPIGMKVTLRGKRMFDFLDKMINAALPRIRDFHGVSNEAFDGRGNYTVGIKEQIVFPEVEYDKIDKIRGLEVCIITTAGSDEEGKRLLQLLGMPFSRQ